MKRLRGRQFLLGTPVLLSEAIGAKAGRGLLYLTLALLTVLFTLASAPQAHAKYASFVIDAKTGQILHSVNADTRNYPASLTKMMTLYMVFDALRSGKWKLSTKLNISARAARQPASKLGLRRGSTITVKQAILSLVTKSANDVATAIGENMAGTERKFAVLMTKKARQLGMSRTTFRNASGLPHRGQMSTARDMSTLALALLRDHRQQYHYFSTRKFTYKDRTYSNHNKLLKSYDGTDGIKTGYIRASGFNLVASAVRNGRRLVGVVFGGNSTKQRNKHMKTLLDKGYRLAALNDNSTNVASVTNRAVIPAAKPERTITETAQITTQTTPKATSKTTQVVLATGSKSWGVQVGAYAKQKQALEVAKKAVKLAPSYLNQGIILIAKLKKKSGKILHRSRIKQLTKKQAYQACRQLKSKNHACMELRSKTQQVASN